jgi:hypothetical protein
MRPREGVSAIRLESRLSFVSASREDGNEKKEMVRTWTTLSLYATESFKIMPSFTSRISDLMFTREKKMKRNSLASAYKPVKHIP